MKKYIAIGLYWGTPYIDTGSFESAEDAEEGFDDNNCMSPIVMELAELKMLLKEKGIMK